MTSANTSVSHRGQKFLFFLLLLLFREILMF